MKVVLRIDPIWLHIETVSPEISSILENGLKYRPKGYQYLWAFKNKRSDGYIRLFDKTNQRCRRGLTKRVIKLLRDAGHEVEYISEPRVTPTVNHKLNTSIKPHKFQQDFANAVLSETEGILVSCVGSGKTYMLALITNLLKKKTLMLVHDLVLMDQMAQAQSKYFNQPIGMIGDGEFDLQDITVSTIQSLHSILLGKQSYKKADLLQYISEVGLVLADEVHRMLTDTVAEVMPFFTNTWYTYGCSGTPTGWGETSAKSENIGLEQHFGPVIYDTEGTTDFVGIGLKVPVYVQVQHITPINTKYIEHKKFNRFSKKYEIDTTANYKECLNTEIINNSGFHDILIDKISGLTKMGKSVFVYAAHNLTYTKSIYGLLKGTLHTEYIDGSTPRLERRAIYDRLRSKESLVLVSDLGVIGLDIPSLDCIILATDALDVRQICGRVARAAPGKSYGLVVDFIFDACMFLEKHAQTREEQYIDAGYVVIK